MAALRWWVVLAVVLCVPGVAPANVTEVGGVPVDFPCDGKAKTSKGRTGVVCDGVSFGAEVGAFTPDAYVAKLTKGVAEDQFNVREIEAGGKRALLLIYSDGKALVAVLVVGEVVGDKGLALIMVAPAAKAESGGEGFEKMVTATFAGLAGGGSGGGSSGAAEEQYESQPPKAKPQKKQGKDGGRVGFTIEWAQRLDVSPETERLELARDRYGNLMVLVASTNDFLNIASEVAVFEKGSHKSRPTGITVPLIQRQLRGASDWFESLDGNREGNLFIGASIYDGASTSLWAYYHRDSGDLEPVVSLARYRELGDGSDWGGDGAVRPTPDGDAWLFVKQGKGKLRYGKLHRRGPNDWTLTELTNFDTKGVSTTDIARGAADFDGGYVFYSNGWLWRLDSAGKLKKLAEIKRPEDTTVATPVVLENGDIWLAFSMVSEVSQTSWDGPTADTKEVLTTVYQGGHSAWLRVRMVDGKPVYGYIDGDDILAALSRAGLKMSTILKVPKFKIDYKTGGLLAHDTFDDVLFVLVPE